MYTSPTIGRTTWNSINMPQCHLDQKYFSNDFLYWANITPLDKNSKTKVYYDICETTFKLWYANHKKSFNHRNLKSDTEPSKEFWKVKGNNRSANITYKILGRKQANNTNSHRCSLSLHENLKIALHRINNMLNKRTEI